MNKSKFLELVKNPDLIEEKDLTKLAELTSEHPYSQIIHVLNIKGLKIWNKPDFENALNLTAVYSYDRNVLHSIVEEVSTGKQATSQQTPAPADPGLPVEELEESVIEETSDFEWINADLVEKDQSVSQQEEEQGIKQEEEEVEVEGQEQGKGKEKEEVDTESEKKPGLEDPLNLEIEASGIHAELMENLSQLRERRQQYEGQNDETGDQAGRKEQIEIVDDFIKNSPVLSKPNLNAESEIMSQKDMAKDSGKFSDELASENLAKILLKQGKRKDAEKIYKKLIGKFPKKKTYFADQIKKIKKK